MQEELTIHLDREIYDGLHRIMSRKNISQFIESLIRPYIFENDLEDAYRLMAQDEAREAEAFDWAEATIGDINDEAR